MTATHDGKVTALISMKGKSDRVPGKNFRPLAGKPCFYWIVAALEAAERVRRVSIETDSDEIEAIANELFPHIKVLRRPDALLDPFINMNPLIEHHMAHSDDEIFLQTHATNPLLTSETIDKAVEAYFAPGDHDSLFTATALQTRLYWEDGRPVNHNPEEMLPTQHLPPILEENSCVYIFSRESYATLNHRVGAKPKIFTTAALESVDIDEEHDFAYCEFLMTRRLADQAHP